MKIVLGSDQDGLVLKDKIKSYLRELGYESLDKTEFGSEDFLESTKLVANEIMEDKETVGVLFDGYGVGSFIAANKIKGMIAAEVSDERSAKMTRDHNHTRIITIGSKIVGEELAKSCVKAFVQSKYSGGRHQIRVDMLNKML